MNRRSFFIHGSRYAGALLAATPVRARAQTGQKRLRFGVIAELANEPDPMLRVYSDLLAQLRLKLASRGIKVAPLIITRDLAELARLLAQGEVDMVCETVFVTLRLFPAGQPKAPRNAAFYAFAGAELNQAIWVLKGKGDAGAFNEGDWNRLPEKVRAGLVIFHETQPLLRGLVSFRNDVDPTIRRASEQALLDLHPEEAGRRALRQADGITRFEPLTARDVDGLALWRRALRNAEGQ